MFSKDTILKIARSAKLEISDNEIIKSEENLHAITAWLENIKSVNTDNIEPLINIISDIESFVVNYDNESSTISTADCLKNATHSDGEYFLVPKVIE